MLKYNRKSFMIDKVAWMNYTYEKYSVDSIISLLAIR